MSTTMQHGDFSQLAENYSKFRPGYAPEVLTKILDKVGQETTQISFADIGAGTGIWTRMVAERIGSAVAVEPNDQMRTYGEADNNGLDIQWKRGSAEQTGLIDHSFDLVTMASSFHWPDFDQTTREFARILKPGGIFTALWNPRLIEVNPLLVEIEAKLKDFIGDKKRVSSGRSEFCATLEDRLRTCGVFDEVTFVEGQHVEEMSRERYLGVWRSVNDIRVLAGEENFNAFMDFIESRIKNEDKIEATYLTRAWIARTRI